MSMAWSRGRCVAASAAVAGMVFVAAGRAGQVEVAAQAGADSAGPRATVEGVAGTATADVTIRHRRVTTDGGPSGPVMPPVSMKLERRQYSGRWRTTLTLLEAAQPMVRTAGGLVTLDNPFLVSRLEFDEGEGDARMYDRLGRRLARPTDTERRRFGVTPAQRGAGWDPRILHPWRRVTRRAPSGCRGLADSWRSLV